MTTIEFTKDFASKKKGEKVELDSVLASSLVRQRKVAKFVKAIPSKKAEKVEPKSETKKEIKGK